MKNGKFTFLRMVSVLDHDHGGSLVAFSEVGKIHEGAFVELVDGDISKPDIEPLFIFIQQAGVVVVEYWGVQTNFGVEVH